MRKIGIRYYDTCLTEENFRAMNEGGMTAVELCCVREPAKLDFKKVRKLADEYCIDIWTCHLPFHNEWCVVQKTEDERKRAYDFQCMLIERATDIGVTKFVSHPSTGLPEDLDRRDGLNYTKEAHYNLAEFASARGAEIAVENMIPKCLGNCADELLDIVSVNEKLRICFDTNHLLLDTHEDFADKVRDKLITMHINDYDFVNEKHWLAGEGKIDWISLYKKICEIGYNGAWIYELSPGTINEHRSRPLTVRDFYNNAMEIFSGKAPSRI